MTRKCQGGSERLGITGNRVRTLRTEHGLSQTQLGKLTGTSCTQISVIEREEAGSSLRTAIAIAKALNTSLDYLVGQIDDPKPAREIASELKAKTAHIQDLEAGQAEPLDPIDTTVGTDGTVRDDTVTCRLKLPRAWLHKHGLRAHTCRIVRMTGDGMDPTIPDGSAILVDTASTDRRDGSIAVVRIDEPSSRETPARRPGSGLAPLERQPRQERLAHRAVARRRNRRRRGQVARARPSYRDADIVPESPPPHHTPSPRTRRIHDLDSTTRGGRIEDPDAYNSRVSRPRPGTPVTDPAATPAGSTAAGPPPTQSLGCAMPPGYGRHCRRTRRRASRKESLAVDTANSQSVSTDRARVRADEAVAGRLLRVTPGRQRSLVDSGGCALAGPNRITVVVQVTAHVTRLDAIARGVPCPPFLALAAQSGGFEFGAGRDVALARRRLLEDGFAEPVSRHDERLAGAEAVGGHDAEHHEKSRCSHGWRHICHLSCLPTTDPDTGAERAIADAGTTPIP